MNESFMKFAEPRFCSTCYWWEHQMFGPGYCAYYKNTRNWNTDASQCAHWVTIDSLYARGD